MGCCDGTTDDELVPGADWVWAYSTSNDVTGWENPLVELWMGDTLLASSQGDDPKVSLDAFGDHPATDEIESFPWPGDVRRYTHVTEILFFARQGIQFRTPAGGAGAHRLITVQPITSSPN